MNYIIGIDGGGTKTLGYLADLKGNILASAVSGSSNYLSTGYENTKNALSDVINSLCNRTNIKKNKIKVISLGLAGADRSNVNKVVEKIIRNLEYNNDIIINNDAYISLVGAHGKEEGIIVICGTGSIAFGVGKEGKIARVGGWGHILGDEGSGYYIAKEGLSAIVKAYDGRERSTILTEMIFNNLSIKNIDELVEYVYSNRDNKSAISRLTPCVLKAADEGDYVANKIIDKGIDELIFMITTIIKRLNNDDKLNIVLAGGVFENSELVRKKFITKIKKQNLKNKIVRKEYDAAMGAVIIALKRLGIY